MNWNRFKPKLHFARPRFSALSLALSRGRRGSAASESGMSLLELVVACAILLVLATASIPIARYKDASDKGQIQVKAGTEGYPESLDSLVKPTPLTGTAADKRIRFLRE